MRKTIFTHGDQVLLLGEGNFSFSLALLDIGCELSVTATCFESTLSAKQFENSNFLKRRGKLVYDNIKVFPLQYFNLKSLQILGPSQSGSGCCSRSLCHDRC